MKSRADPVDDAALLAGARQSIARGSKSFALASRLFDRESRDRATLLYAWCRYADDVIDGQEAGHGQVVSDQSAEERMRRLEAATEAALAGSPPDSLAFLAIARVAADTGLPARYPRDLLDGFRMDVAGTLIESENDLLRYCYYVAGAVGVMMAIAMGVRPDDHPTLARASDLGIAFQLNNIARDIAEDHGNGRCYLPASWLAEEGLSPTTLMDSGKRAPVFRLATRLVDLAQPYERSARAGVPALALRQAWAVLAAARIYGDIGRKLVKAGPQALGRRMVTSRAEKLAAVAAAYPQAWLRGRVDPGTPRQNLFTPAFV